MEHFLEMLIKHNFSRTIEEQNYNNWNFQKIIPEIIGLIEQKLGIIYRLS